MGCGSSSEQDAVKASNLQPVVNGNNHQRPVKDLEEVRQLITASVKDEGVRRTLLRMAGKEPGLWSGCAANDVVAIMTHELAERQRAAQDAKAVDSPPVQYVQAAQQPVQYVQMPPREPVYVRQGPGLGSAVLTGVVAGRVAGRTAARTAARRRR